MISLAAETVAVVINSELRNSVSTELDTYVADLTAEGHEVIVQSWNPNAAASDEPEELKAYLRTIVGLDGAVFIGELPIAYYEGFGELAYTSDLYFMDIDQDWEDRNTNSGPASFDTFVSGRQPRIDIWVSRIWADTDLFNGVSEVNLVKRWFDKNKAFRRGTLRLNDRALLYDAHVLPGSRTDINKSLGVSYSDSTEISLRQAIQPSRADYLNRASTIYETEFLNAFGNETSFAIDGGSIDGTDVVTANPARLFYILSQQLAGSYIRPGSLSLAYLLSNDYGINVVASSKINGAIGVTANDRGASLMNQLGTGATFGQALKAYWQAVLDNSDDTVIALNYGIVMLGDGTLQLGRYHPVIADTLPGVVSISPAAIDIFEGASGTKTRNLSVRRNGGADGTASVTYSTSNGSAIAGQDYLASSGTLQWADGESDEKIISITIIGDTSQEDDETFTVNLGSVTGATIGNDSSTITIFDDDDAPASQLAFSTTTVGVTENEGQSILNLTITRTATASGEASIAYETIGQTATSPNDFSYQAGRISWADGDSEDKTLTLIIRGDEVAENTETFTVVLSDPSGNAVVGNNSTMTITINDNDTGAQPGTLSLASDSYETSEGDSGSKTLNITVNRSGGSNGIVGLSYETIVTNATSAAPASSDVDFTAASGTVSWADGDSSAKTITITIIGDSDFEADEDFKVVLSNPTGDAALGLATATITIMNDDASPDPKRTIAITATSGGGVVPTSVSISPDDATTAAPATFEELDPSINYLINFGGTGNATSG